jgi:BolA protein
MNVAAEIRSRLGSLDPERVELVDESAQHAGHASARPGGNTHWRLTIVSRRFDGKNRVSRHRLVYAALGELMQDPIHALAITAHTPEETKGKQ